MAKLQWKIKNNKGGSGASWTLNGIEVTIFHYQNEYYAIYNEITSWAEKLSKRKAKELISQIDPSMLGFFGFKKTRL